jgi:DNA-binding PadR family transcriptional regulator
LTDRQREYALKQSLEQEFGDLLPALNAGQIYATLGRLERDGLVLGQAVPGDGRGKRVYELTDAGRAALAAWIELPVSGRRLKDEFFVKFIVVASMQLADSTQLLEGQRRESIGLGLKDLLAIPLGIGLYLALFAIAGDGTEEAVLAPWWSLALIPIGTVLVVVAATSLPARLATRISTADALRCE